MRTILVAAALFAASACAPLTARAPLFAPADQGERAPLAEGVWAQITETCHPEMTAQTVPRACGQGQIARARDGSWRLSLSPPGRAATEAPQTQWRFVLAPATDRRAPHDYAPLYVAEYTSSDDPAIYYAVIVPLGPPPARQLVLIPLIECDDALHDGAIAGVRLDLDADAKPLACYASTQRAVRQAARRAVIERLSDMLGPDSIRLVHVGRSPRPSPPRAAVLTVSATQAR